MILLVLPLLLALYGFITVNNLIRKVMCLNIIEGIIILFFLAAGAERGAVAPILSGTGAPETIADPLPQALMLTAIVISVCFNTLALAVIVRIHYRYGTIEVEELHER